MKPLPMPDEDGNVLAYMMPAGDGRYTKLDSATIKPADLLRLQTSQTNAHRRDHLAWTTAMSSAKSQLGMFDPNDKKQATQYKAAQDAVSQLKSEEPKLDDYLAPIKEAGGKTATGGGSAATPKVLDTATASQFLKQAGGDKAKAREMARQAGYTF
jgi:hypothetical protein